GGRGEIYRARTRVFGAPGHTSGQLTADNNPNDVNAMKTRHFGSTAFTLIEVLLALAISAIILAAIGGVFYSAIRLRDRTSAALDESAPMHQAFAVLQR